MPTPIATPAIYQNPFMAPNDFSEVHFNAYQTDTCSVKGPANAAYQSVQQRLIQPPGIAATIAFNAKGQLVTIRIGISATGESGASDPTILLLEPGSLETIAKCTLPPRQETSGLSFAGGYFYLDQAGNVVCVTGNQQIQIYSTDNNTIKLNQSYDLALALNNIDDALNSVLPDSAGNYWFISQAGIVGYVDASNQQILSCSVQGAVGADAAEKISKSFASDGNDGVYVVTDYALYRYQASTNGPQNVWRTTYDRGTETKSGQNQQGSGTTPTCFDDFEGNQFVAITDNATQMHVNVYRRESGKLAAQQAVFIEYPEQNSCENSLIALNHSIIVENNFGNSDVKSTIGPLTTTPGINRVDFDPATGESQVVWANNSISVPSVVSQLSSGDGLLYTYAKDADGWYWAALDFETGQLFKRSATIEFLKGGIVGETLANNYYAGLSIGPDGNAYLSVLGGFVIWQGLSSPKP
ncbi:hypothetical protein ACO0K9_20395 [Undibacterium sp. Ji50W]|uniref:hypothetical protein n=1 Tax=Undibacterium sp. Ji50W TaxID=3413041 RepID=UPI003BF3DE4D